MRKVYGFAAKEFTFTMAASYCQMAKKASASKKFIVTVATRTVIVAPLSEQS